MSVKFLTAVACDEIRQEANGKLILIGCYTEAVVFSRFPAAAPLSLLARVQFESAGESNFFIRVMIGDDVAAEMGGDVQVQDLSHDGLWLPVILPPMSYAGETVLRAEARESEGAEWYQFLALKITKGQVVQR